jgi:hypothetical protein
MKLTLEVLQPYIGKFVVVYLDDTRIFNGDREELLVLFFIAREVLRMFCLVFGSDLAFALLGT